MTTNPSQEPLKDTFERLRASFPPQEIGKKPKGKPDPKANVTHCKVCRQRHAANITFHVDYIGHAAITHRLNTVAGVDGWSYSRTIHTTPDGMHVLAVSGVLTILGISKGEETGGPSDNAKTFADELKTATSDLLCRAAMRFGVGLELWAKQELGNAPEAGEKPRPAAPVASAEASAAEPAAADLELIGWPGFQARCRAAGITEGDARAILADTADYGADVRGSRWRSRVNDWGVNQLTEAFAAIASKRGEAA